MWSGLSVAFGLYWNAILRTFFLWIRKANSFFPSGQLPASGIFWFLTSWGAAFFVSEISKNTGCFISEWQTNSSAALSMAELKGVSLATGALAWSRMWSHKPAFPDSFRWPHETTRKVGSTSPGLRVLVAIPRDFPPDLFLKILDNHRASKSYF